MIKGKVLFRRGFLGGQKYDVETFLFDPEVRNIFDTRQYSCRLEEYPHYLTVAITFLSPDDEQNVYVLKEVHVSLPIDTLEENGKLVRYFRRADDKVRGLFSILKEGDVLRKVEIIDAAKIYW